ncbi:MAG: HsdR family type I site-specific deoxyribonuclease [Saprospiraceae bacterium]
MAADKTPPNVRIEEKNHVEEPFLLQLETMPGLHWKVLRLDNYQAPVETQRTEFSQVIMKDDLAAAIKKINSWLEDDQVQEVIEKVTRFEGDNLLQNNELALQLLLKGTSVNENRRTCERSPDVAIVDFDHPENNTYVAVSQFKVRIPGTDNHIYPDIICFLNGLPVVVIEAKSPKAKEPIPEAIDQLMRYCEQRNYQREGNKSLFYFNQFIVATSRQRAKFGTITTSIEKHFYRWTDPFPATIDELIDYCNPQKHLFVDEQNNDEDIEQAQRTSPNDQQRLVHGMLKPENLLSIIRSFSVFSTDSKGNVIRIVGRYQQFRAVKKTVHQLLNGTNKKERGGIIWHTQGSGKSLTMVFLIREMWLHPKLQSYKVILLTDRTQLDDQIKETAQGVGYTINDPNSIAKVKASLRSNSSEIVSCMIHKFQERELADAFPELNTSENILILTDEAHRSQYSLLGANLDRALPNATRIAFTGTPIEKTEETFGDYIDKYTMRQAIKDGVTLEIVYEGRTHNAEVEDKVGADAKFSDVFSDYNLNERLQLLGFGSRDAYLEAKETIRDKAKDMLQHFVQQVFPNGFKAQIVTCSKEAAHRYHEAVKEEVKNLVAELKTNNPNNINIELLENMKAEVVVSSGHNDPPHIKALSDSSKNKEKIASFKIPFGKEKDGVKGDVGILIVCDMLLTGFDAPIEQVMYLDKVIVAHNLLQAIARVNRVDNDDKDVGFIVDYVGVGHHLKKALDIYFEKEQQEILSCITDPTELFKELDTTYKEVWKLFKENGIEDLSDSDAFYDLFYDEDIRFKFIDAYRKFMRAIDNVFPRKEALDYVKDMFRFTELNVLAGQHFRDSRMSMKGIPAKLRSITDEFLKSQGIEQKIEPISIMDENFFDHVKTKQRTKTKAAEVEHAIRHFIDINITEDPELYASFAEALAEILREFKNNWDEIYSRLEELRRKIMDKEKEPTYGLHRKKQMPLFRIFKKEFYGDKADLLEDEITILVTVTKEVFEKVKLEIGAIGFWRNIPSQNRLKGEIVDILLSEEQGLIKTIPGIFGRRNEIASRIMELAKSNHDIILYAA